MKYLKILLAVIVIGLAVATLVPRFIPIGDSNLALTSPFSQIIAMRGIIAIVVAVIAVIVGIIGIVRFSLMRRGVTSLLIAIGLLVVSGIHLYTLNDRGMSAPSALPADHGITHVSQGNGTITVLSYNTLGGKTGMSDLATVVDDNGVDVVVLTETSTARGEELVSLLDARGLPFTLHESGADPYAAEINSTIVLTSTALGEYRQRDLIDTSWGSIRLSSVNGTAPEIFAVHPISPSSDTDEQWRAEITATYGLCSEFSNTIMAGDFNSTIDHMRATGASCPSALDGYIGGAGTWPTSMPPLLGSPIDGVYSDLDTESAALIDVGDSDHRGVLVRLHG